MYLSSYFCAAKKKYERVKNGYAEFLKIIKNQQLSFLVIDEIYTYVNKKSQKMYVWTAKGQLANGEWVVFASTSTSKSFAGLNKLLKDIPKTNNYYSDNNPAYKKINSCMGKGAKTNLVESFNSQLRQFVSSLKRKTKAFSKKEDNLFCDILLIVNKINKKR